MSNYENISDPAPTVGHQLSPTKILVLGFLVLVLAGGLLLWLPISTKDGSTSFLNAMFTAVSAGCVTGLITYDTAIHWSRFGQAVILMLIQIGGLGFITILLGALTLSRKKINFRQRLLLQESISAPQNGGILRLARLVLKVTATVELAGAVLLSIKFVPIFGWADGIWRAVFHSISAFCNAGFDLMGDVAQFSSFTTYRGDALVTITLMLLIIIGGLGFYVWDDVREQKFQLHRYSLQTKIVLSVSAFLIIVPAVFLFFSEGNNPAFSDGTLKERVLASLFQSVTTRTAGFNTVDYAQMSQPAQFVSSLLMLVGGSPGSTAGGMKTTTVFVLLLCVSASFRRRSAVEVFNRRLNDTVVRRAVTIVTLYLLFAASATIALSLLESIPLLPAMFEVCSAIGTVGLSTGITPSLCAASRIIIMMLMFFGRIGGLTMLYAMTRVHNVPSRLPEETLAVG